MEKVCVRSAEMSVEEKPAETQPPPAYSTRIEVRKRRFSVSMRVTERCYGGDDFPALNDASPPELGSLQKQKSCVATETVYE